jgi:GNAT superfamily N-acetyltransferase
VEPRPEFHGLLRNNRVPWEGRNEDKGDASVWAITCLFVRAGFRKRGISAELAAAAVEHARSRGARAVEAYPMIHNRVIEEELHVGTIRTYADAGLTEIARPSPRRAVMRVDFDS